ncbi:DUF4040 family protein [Micrococcoides hystricis]|uniref:DUF4040 family protein n=1 Tax=Micrococcoides hystricis TaxID=1572761 RepID=A0ABV6PCW6_9MICC
MPVLLTLGCLSLSVALAWPLSRVMGRHAGWVLAPLYVLAAALFTPAALPVLTGNADTTATDYSIPWVPGLGVDFAFHTDGIGVLFTYIATLIGAIVFLYATKYLTDKENHTSFYLVMTIFTLAMVGLVLTNDLVVLFICWELTSLASFLLIARSGTGGQEASLRTLLLTFIGGLTLLAAVALMAFTAGTTAITEVLGHTMWSDVGFTTLVVVLIIIAAGTKSAQFPFHVWLPDAMAAATPVSAYLHAAAVVKAGIFLLMRFSPAFHENLTWSTTLVFLGLITSIVGGWFAFAQPDLKKLMAYSTVSQLGLIVAAIGTGTELGMIAAIIHTIVHALFKSGLFMMVGVIDHATGTRQLDRMPQLYKAMPVSFIVTLLGTAAMAGLPPLFGFLSKESILTAVYEHPLGAGVGISALVLAGIGAVLTFSYCAKILVGAFITGEADKDIHPTPAMLIIPAALPILASAVLVFFLPAVEKFITPMVDAGLPIQSHPHLTLWHGFTPPLFVTLAVFVIGFILLAKYKSVWPYVERKGKTITGAEVIAAITGVITRASIRLGRVTDSMHAATHVAPMLAGLGAIGFASLFVFGSSGSLAPFTPGINHPIDAVVLVLIIAAVATLIFATTRLAATLALSAIGGLAVVQIISLGAPDVALTQLLVEALTIIVIMLVLQKLPLTFGSKHRFQPGKFTFAALVGLGAGAAAFTFLGRRERSDVARYYLENTQEITGGDNIVNVILVEFRALDTMGELIVLGMTGVAIIAILSTIRNDKLDPTGSKDPAFTPEPELALRGPESAAARGVRISWGNVVQLQLMLRMIVPILTILSAIIFWRGHNEPGGGFIAALVGSAVVGLLYLSTSTDRQIGPPRLPVYLIGAGVGIAVLTGFWGLLGAGSFLEPIGTYFLGQHLSTALVFDLGVYLAVLGLMMVAFNLLGTSTVKQLDPTFGVDEAETKHSVAEWGISHEAEERPEYTRERTDESVSGPLPGPMDEIGPTKIKPHTQYIASGTKPKEVGRK